MFPLSFILRTFPSLIAKQLFQSLHMFWSSSPKKDICLSLRNYYQPGLSDNHSASILLFPNLEAIAAENLQVVLEPLQGGLWGSQHFHLELDLTVWVWLSIWFTCHHCVSRPSRAPKQWCRLTSGRSRAQSAKVFEVTNLFAWLNEFLIVVTVSDSQNSDKLWWWWGWWW